MPGINTKRIYEKPSDEDGLRILVDRLWPRGIGKEKAIIDFWFKDIAPSAELRKLYHAAEINFNEFRKRYLIELAKCNDEADNPLSVISSFLKNDGKTITLLYGLKDETNNNAAVLKEFIESILA